MGTPTNTGSVPYVCTSQPREGAPPAIGEELPHKTPFQIPEAHHKQRMSLAAVKNDAMASSAALAMAIRKRLLAKKQLPALHRRACGFRLRWVGLSRPPTHVMYWDLLGAVERVCPVALLL